MIIAIAQSSEVPPVAPDSLWTILSSGGVTGLLILLVLVSLSVAAVYLVVDQWFSLRRADFIPASLTADVRQMIQNSRFGEAEALLKQKPSVLSGLVAVGLSHREEGWPEIEKSVEDAMVDHAASLHRRIDYLSMIANLAPMVGLLGTVTGMIFAFRQVASTSGAAGAADLAEGIYQALVTTVGGLLVAIPSLAASGILRSRVDALMSEVTRHADTALRPLRRRGATLAGAGRGSIPVVPPAKLSPQNTSTQNMATQNPASQNPATQKAVKSSGQEPKT